MTDRELMQQALEALVAAYQGKDKQGQVTEAITALRERLAQPLVSTDGTSTWIDIPQRPVTPREMQPCAGRNCGSTNPNLHSAECFEDYEKSTGMAQPEQEPVAWMHTKLDGVVVPHRPADLDKHPDRWEALYRTPPPCPTCEALARTVMLDQTSHDTQRKPLPPQSPYEMTQSEGKMFKLGWLECEAAHGIKGGS